MADKHPDREAWRRNLVNRYQAAGWVDAEGNPSDELARVLAPLTAMGLAVRDDSDARQSRVGLVLSDDGATGVIRAPGRDGGFFLRPFPQDRGAWPAFFRTLMPAGAYPFSPACADYHAAWAEPAEEDLAGACKRGDEAYARDYAGRHGLDAAFAVGLARGFKGSRKYMPYVMDYTGCEPTEGEGGWQDTGTSTGLFRARRALVVPEIGAVFSDCNAWNSSVPQDWTTDPDPWRDATAFYSADFHASGDLFEALCYAPAYPGQEDKAQAEAARRRWLA